ncbi:MAG: metallophosphoesterase [Oscillospiraceae bacterium]
MIKTIMLVSVPLMLMTACGCYFYSFYRRMLVHRISDNKKLVLASSALTLVSILPAFRIMSAGIFVTLFLLMACIASDILNLLFTAVLKNRTSLDIWKRIYMGGALAFFLFAAVFLYGTYNARNVVLTRYEIESEKSVGQEELAVALISDLHLGSGQSLDKLERTCAQIDEQSPDVVVLAGDIFDENTKNAEISKAAKLLGSLRSRYGVYYVFGNHEMNMKSADGKNRMYELRALLEQNNITVLDNERILVADAFYIAGRSPALLSTDIERESWDKLLCGADRGKLIIGVDHRPRSLESAAQNGVDLQLSGHTHAGQIWPVGQIAELCGVNEMNYGIEKIGNYQIIVSSGAGGWGFPMRIGSHAEIVIATLK